MESIFALMRIAIPVAALIASLVTIPMAQVASSNASSNESFKATAYQRSDRRSESTYPFEFHSGFWINLHHFLYEQALLRKRATNSVQATNSATKANNQLSRTAATLEYGTRLLCESNDKARSAA